jgi:hypothetical protein
MANLGETFDPATVEAGEFDILPEGEYFAVIVESEMKPTKAGTGEILKLTYQIVDGAQEGRKFWENLNIRNPNEIAQRIALQSLKKICEATGAGAITDSEELHGKPLFVKLVIKKQEGYSDKNEVKGYRAHVPGAAKPAAAKPAGGVGAAKPAPAGAKPWGQRATA